MKPNCAFRMSVNVTEFQNHFKKIKIPWVLTELTGQQWINFACIYARPCLVGLIPDKGYQSILLLCQVVEFIHKLLQVRKHHNII